MHSYSVIVNRISAHLGRSVLPVLHDDVVPQFPVICVGEGVLQFVPVRGQQPLQGMPHYEEGHGVVQGPP